MILEYDQWRRNCKTLTKIQEGLRGSKPPKFVFQNFGSMNPFSWYLLLDAKRREIWGYICYQARSPGNFWMLLYAVILKLSIIFYPHFFNEKIIENLTHQKFVGTGLFARTHQVWSDTP